MSGRNPEPNEEIDHDLAHSQAHEALGLVVRYDEHRKPDAPRWTVAITGVGRGDGYTPAEAGGALRRLLAGMRVLP